MSANPLNGFESLVTNMAAAAHAQEKPKAKERRLTNRNFKRVYEELNDIDELVQDVLNVRSLTTNRYALSCKCLLPRPKANDSAIVYEYVTHACTCIDINIRMWRKGGAVWFSIIMVERSFPLCVPGSTLCLLWKSFVIVDLSIRILYFLY